MSVAHFSVTLTVVSADCAVAHFSVTLTVVSVARFSVTLTVVWLCLWRTSA